MDAINIIRVIIHDSIVLPGASIKKGLTEQAYIEGTPALTVTCSEKLAMRRWCGFESRNYSLE